MSNGTRARSDTKEHVQRQAQQFLLPKTIEAGLGHGCRRDCELYF